MRLACALCAAVFAMPLFGQYGGPAILSRGEAPSAMRLIDMSFRPFLELTGVYDTGLSGPIVNSQGQLANAASFGIQFTGGVSGSHSWKHTTLGLDYSGSVAHYTQTTFYDGTNQSLLLGVTHQVSRHSTLSLRESAGLFSTNIGLLGMPMSVPFDPSMGYIPVTDFYDNRTIYLSSQADYSIQKSTRLSFDFGGDAFLTRRRSSALYGVGGAGARADVQYRLSKRTTIGAGYTYSKYMFLGIFGATDNHSIIGTYAIQITKTLEFTGYAGVMRTESKFLQPVAIDPAIALIIGRSSGSLISHQILNSPNINARLSRAFRRGVAYVSGGHTVIPGNGLFLTSTTTDMSGGYTYTGLRRWSLNAQIMTSQARSVGNVIGNYGMTSGTITGSRTIGRSISIIGSFSARKYQSSDFANYNRVFYNATFGLGFTPGDVPLRIW